MYIHTSPLWIVDLCMVPASLGSRQRVSDALGIVSISPYQTQKREEIIVIHPIHCAPGGYSHHTTFFQSLQMLLMEFQYEPYAQKTPGRYSPWSSTEAGNCCFPGLKAPLKIEDSLYPFLFFGLLYHTVTSPECSFKNLS